MSIPFRIYARGCQNWEMMDVNVINGRVTITVGDSPADTFTLSRIQSEELTLWLRYELNLK